MSAAYEDYLEDFDGDEDDFDFEDFENFEEDDDLESLAEAALDDPDAEDEFLGAIGGLLAKAVPAIATTIVPQALKFGRRLLKGRRRRAIRRLPRVARRARRVIRRNRRAIRRRPDMIQAILSRLLRGLA